MVRYSQLKTAKLRYEGLKARLVISAQRQSIPLASIFKGTPKSLSSLKDPLGLQVILAIVQFGPWGWSVCGSRLSIEFPLTVCDSLVLVVGLRNFRLVNHNQSTEDLLEPAAATWAAMLSPGRRGRRDSGHW